MLVSRADRRHLPGLRAGDPDRQREDGDRSDAKEFAEAVDRVATISTEKARAVKLGFDDGTVTISAVSAETGRAVEELDVDYAGDALEIGFNARYILDMLQEIDGDDGALRDGRAPPHRPWRATPPTPSTLYVLMPMRV